MALEKNNLKLCIFTGSPIQNLGGAEKDAIGVAKILGDVIICCPGKEEKEYVYDGVSIVSFKSHTIRLLKDQISFSRININKEFTAVYVMNQGFLLNRRILRRCLKLGIKYIQGIHSPSALALEPDEKVKWKVFLHFFFRMYRDSFLKKIPNFRVQNKDDYKRLLEINPKARIFHFPPYVFDPPKRMKYNNKFTVLWVSRMQREHKGLDLLKNIVINANKEIEFHIVGNGPDRYLLEDIENQNVKILGSVDEDQLRTEFSNADLFLSTSSGENFGIAVAEACVSGLAVVSMPVMGIKEILEFHPYKHIGLVKKASSFMEQVEIFIHAIDDFYNIRNILEISRSEISNFFHEKFNEKLLKQSWINMIVQSKLSIDE